MILVYRNICVNEEVTPGCLSNHFSIEHYKYWQNYQSKLFKNSSSYKLTVKFCTSLKTVECFSLYMIGGLYHFSYIPNPLTLAGNTNIVDTFGNCFWSAWTYQGPLQVLMGRYALHIV